MKQTVQVTMSVYLLCMLVAAFGSDILASATNGTREGLEAVESWDDLEAVNGRAFLQALPRPCRWNPTFGSCDWNYDFVAQIKPKTQAAAAQRQWFINSKSCDSARYQTSRAICVADNSHMCQWVTFPGGKPRCNAVLQELNNYYLACPGSLAKYYYFCKNKFTAANCNTFSMCTWIAARGACVSRASIGRNGLAAQLGSASLAVFRQAWGVCAGSNTAFNQVICGKQRTQAACAAARICTWGVFGASGVCYINSRYSASVFYQNDPSFVYLMKACAKPNQAQCQAVLPPARLASLASSG